MNSTHRISNLIGYWNELEYFRVAAMVKHFSNYNNFGENTLATKTT